jgi:hypothetical protein
VNVSLPGEGRTSSTGAGSSRGDGNKRSGGGAGGVKRPLPRDEDEDVVLLDSEIDGSAPAGRTSGDDHTHLTRVPPARVNVQSDDCDVPPDAAKPGDHGVRSHSLAEDVCLEYCQVSSLLLLSGFLL